jgi:hypothetical protein
MDIAQISEELAAAKERGWSQEIGDLTKGVKERIEGLTSANPSIWERSDLRELNFEDLRPRIRRLQFVAERAASLPISDLPASILSELQSALDQIRASLDEMRNFDLLKIAESRTDPREQRNRILSTAQDRFNQAERSLAIAMGMLGAIARPTDYDGPAKSELLKLAAAAGQASKDAEVIAKLAADSREAVKSLEAARHGEFFGSEARDHKRWSYGWLGATVVVAGLTGFAAWANYQNARSDRGTYVSGGSVAQLIVAKVVLFSIGISATLWCAK